MERLAKQDCRIRGSLFGIPVDSLLKTQHTLKFHRGGVSSYKEVKGWWNSTPASGNTEGLPQETVAVNTRTGKVVDAFNRATNSTSIPDVSFEVVPNPSWPANSVVIIDTASGKVIEDFLVNEKGSPFDEYGQPIQPSQP